MRVSHRTKLRFTLTCGVLRSGVIGGQLKIMEDEPGFGLHSEPRQGALQSGFVVGFALSAPIFSVAAHRVSPTKLICLGLVIWIGSAVLAAISWSYSVLLIARVLIGIGEASFAGLAPSYIDDVAPPERRTLWLSIFFSAIAVGQVCSLISLLSFQFVQKKRENKKQKTRTKHSKKK